MIQFSPSSPVVSGFYCVPAGTFESLDHVGWHLEIRDLNSSAIHRPCILPTSQIPPEVKPVKMALTGIFGSAAHPWEISHTRDLLAAFSHNNGLVSARWRRKNFTHPLASVTRHTAMKDWLLHFRREAITLVTMLWILLHNVHLVFSRFIPRFTIRQVRQSRNRKAEFGGICRSSPHPR